MSHESISALLDGECSTQELDRLLDEMERTPELKAAFSRLVMAREAGEGTRIARGQPSIVDGVMAALDAPVADRPNVKPITPPPAVRRPALQWRPLAGLAAAAAFGAIAVLVALPQGHDAAGTSATAGLAPQASLPVASVERDPGLTPVGMRVEDAQAAELREYLMDHSYAADRGIGTPLASARFAAHTAEYRPDADAVGSGR